MIRTRPTRKLRHPESSRRNGFPADGFTRRVSKAGRIRCLSAGCMAWMAAWTSRGSRTRRTLGLIRKELVEFGIRQRLIAALFKLLHSGVNLFD